MNSYLRENLGILTPVMDTSYVLYNLYVRKLKRRQQESTCEPTKTMGSTYFRGTFSSTTSSDGQPVQTVAEAILPFIRSIAEMESLPLRAESERRKRRRFLDSFFAASFPPAARELLRGIDSLNALATSIFETDLPAVQPATRVARQHAQGVAQHTLEELRTARSVIDDALNSINSLDTDDPDSIVDEHEEELYAACDFLYTEQLIPRFSACERLLYATSALVTRTEEVCLYAWRHLGPVLSVIRGKDFDAIRTVMQQNVSEGNMRLLEAVAAILGCYQFRPNATQLSQSVEFFTEETLKEQVERLELLGVADAAEWTRTTIRREFEADSENRPAQRTSSNASNVFGSRTASFTRHSSGTLYRTRSAMEADIESLVDILREWEASGSTTLLATSRIGEKTNVDPNILLDAVGRINNWLRRSGLAISEISKDTSGQKTSCPAPSASESPFVPHRCDEALGWDRERSALYEEACLTLQLHGERSAVLRRLDDLLSLSDVQFFQECHQSDMLVPLLKSADDSGVACESRNLVERRLRNLMTVRVKVRHYAGEVRVRMLSQLCPLKEVLQSFEDSMNDIRRCQLYHIDEGDRVALSSEEEWAQFLRTLRAATIAAATTSRGPSLDLKVELYAEDPLADAKMEMEVISPVKFSQGSTKHVPTMGASILASAGSVLHDECIGVTKGSPPRPPPAKASSSTEISEFDPRPRKAVNEESAATPVLPSAASSESMLKRSAVAQPSSPPRVASWQPPPRVFNFAVHSNAEEAPAPADPLSSDEGVPPKRISGASLRRGAEYQHAIVLPRRTGPLRRGGVPLPPEARKQ